MLGVFLVEPRRVEVLDRLDEPECPADGALVRVRACGICGGDLKRYRYGEGPFPSFLGGHEYSGEVVAVGDGAGLFSVGDTVVRCFSNWCGLCSNCLLGSPNYCTGAPRLAVGGGGFAEYVAVRTPARGCGLYRVPSGLSLVEAAASEPAACALGAALRGQPSAGQWAAVVGLGAIGHFTAQVLRGIGLRVIGIDVSEARLSAARAFCDELVDSSQADPVATVTEITGGVGVDRAYEAVGVDQAFSAAIRMTRMGGITVLAGVFRKPMESFDPEWLFRRDLTVVAAKGPRPLLTSQGVPLVHEYMARGIIRPEAAVAVYPLARAGEAFRALSAAECLKAVIVPG